jgi:type IV secretion system protein TrbF
VSDNPIKQVSLGSQGGETPYLAARQTWADDNARARAGERVWQAVAIAALLVALAAVGGVTYVGSQSKRVPFVVVTDRLGTVLASGVADRSTPADKGKVRVWLQNFIQWTRTVTPDATLQYRFVHEAYAMLNQKDAGYNQLETWYKATKDSLPKVRAEKVMVSVENLFAQQLSPETWSIDWTEVEQDRDGRTLKTFPMRATLTAYTATIDNARLEVQAYNPFGVFVKAFTWSPTPQ